MTDVQLTEIERDILVLIDEMRQTHRACSPGMIARRLGKAKAWIIKNCDRLRDKGLVDWSPGLGGSLHRTGTTETQGDPVPTGAARRARPSEGVATAWDDDLGRITGKALRSTVGKAKAKAKPEIPPDAPEVVIDGQVLHIDRAAIAARLAALPKPKSEAESVAQLAKAGRRTARRKSKEKAARPKRERTPAQIAATQRMIDAANAAKAAKKVSV